MEGAPFLAYGPIFLDCMKIGGQGSLITCDVPGISIQSLTQSLFLTPIFRDTQLYTSYLIKIYSRTGNNVLLKNIDYNDVK